MTANSTKNRAPKRAAFGDEIAWSPGALSGKKRARAWGLPGAKPQFATLGGGRGGTRPQRLVSARPTRTPTTPGLGETSLWNKRNTPRLARGGKVRRKARK